MSAFKNLLLSEELQRSLGELGFEIPTEIQAQAIPLLVREGRDFIGLAQTGTGKTAAFGLPLLDRINTQVTHTQALILAPTRELGQQIAEQLKSFSKYLDKINILAVYGGASIMDQMKALKKNQHIIIATPGRLHDLLRRKSAKLQNLEYLILDEADEMLNMGFKEELDAILAHTPAEKNTWLFSATLPEGIQKIVNTYMSHPLEVRINPKERVNANIKHQIVKVKPADKAEALARFLDFDPDMRGLVFCRTKNEAQSLAEVLLRKGYRADALHGDLSQMQRDRVMKRFKARELQVLIATDVAARGIDVNDLTHVFHYSLPDGQEYYTHRSGRTARAGKQGASIAFSGARETHKIQRLANQLGISFEQIFIPTWEEIANAKVESWGQKVIDSWSGAPIAGALLKKAGNLFKNLDKHQLLELLLKFEIGRLSPDDGRDLNDFYLPEPRQNYSKKRNGKPRWEGDHPPSEGANSFSQKWTRKRGLAKGKGSAGSPPKGRGAARKAPGNFADVPATDRLGFRKKRKPKKKKIKI